MSKSDERNPRDKRELVLAVNLLALRDQLMERLRGLPGCLTVGIGKQKEKLVFIVSIDPKRFRGGTPVTFRGYGVLVKDFGDPVAHAIRA